MPSYFFFLFLFPRLVIRRRSLGQRRRSWDREGERGGEGGLFIAFLASWRNRTDGAGIYRVGMGMGMGMGMVWVWVWGMIRV